MDGVPLRAGLRADDVVVSSCDEWLFAYNPAGRAGDNRYVFVRVEAGLSVTYGPQFGVVPDRHIEFFGGGLIDVVDDASLVAGARVIDGVFVVGPRVVHIDVDLHQGHRVVTHWDVVGEDARLQVSQTANGALRTRRLPWTPDGLRFSEIGPSGGGDVDGGDPWRPDERFGQLRPAVIKRFIVDAGRRVRRSVLGWDGKVHVYDGAVDDADLDLRRLWHFNAYASALGSDAAVDAVSDADVAAAYDACDVADDDEVAGVVAGLRPELVRVERQYREELGILAARPR